MPTITLHFPPYDDDGGPARLKEVTLSDEQFAALQADGALGQWVPAEPAHWALDDNCYDADDDEALTDDELFALADTLVKLSSLGENLTDTEAMDLINYCISAPEWAPSFLEDISDIVARSGRSTVPGARWTRH